MKPRSSGAAPRRQASAQRGATLILALIMIVLITLIVVSAFTLSSSNLKSVGNMQVRDEAVAAANQAIERVVGSNFSAVPTAQTVNVDLNKDGTDDYTVSLAAPTCIRATQAPGSEKCDEDHPEMCSGANWYTDWDIQATVNDLVSGAKVEVHQGVRVYLSEATKTAVCLPPSP